MDSRLKTALARRADLLGEPHRAAVRLFDGYREGLPGVVVELYERTLVGLDHRREPEGFAAELERWLHELSAELGFVRSAVIKARRALDRQHRLGRVVLGDEATVAKRVEEDGVRFRVDLTAYQDTTLFLDTRVLRRYLAKEMAGKRVLNTFAYSGSLGVAALKAGAKQVVNTDKSKPLLNLAKESYSLNGLAISKADFIADDFFTVAARLRKSERLFDTVIVDPPYLAEGDRARVDVATDLEALVDKVRPLVGHGGSLVLVVNALFMSGDALMQCFARLAKDGYIAFEQRLDVLGDCAPPLASELACADPTPFNHPTKIAVLRLTRRDQRVA